MGSTRALESVRHPIKNERILMKLLLATDHNSSENEATFDMSLPLSLLLFVYVFNYPPYIFDAFLPDIIRIAIEALVLFILLILNLKYRFTSEQLWIVPFTLIFAIALALGDSVIKLISSYNKLMFLILLVPLLIGFPRLLRVSTKLWLKLSGLFCVMAILAFVGYKSGIIPFSPTTIGNYYYLHNPILGNLIPRGVFDIPLGRVVGYMIEGQYLGFIFGFNVLAGKDWIVDSGRRDKFIWLNLVAGLTTLSTTFFLFFSMYLFSTWSIKGKKPDVVIRVIAFSLMSMVLVGFLFSMSYFEHTSGSERLQTFFMTLTMIYQSDWAELLFGHGILVLPNTDAGWLTVLIERGAIMLLTLLAFLICFTKHKPWLMFYIFVTQCANSQFWYPMFLLLVAMTYAFHKESVRRIVVPSSLLPEQDRGEYRATVASSVKH